LNNNDCLTLIILPRVIIQVFGLCGFGVVLQAESPCSIIRKPAVKEGTGVLRDDNKA